MLYSAFNSPKELASKLAHTGTKMKADRLGHFRELLLENLRKHTEHVREDQAAALELSDDGVKDTVDMSLMDVSKELALRLGERESQMIADIDQALMRIEEGSYGICARCGKVIDERRLEALPTARYDAACQALIESANGDDEHATL
jgi:DnaK suppressor protein